VKQGSPLPILESLRGGEVKVQITTIREFDDSDYWDWAKGTMASINLVSRKSTGKDRIKLGFFKRLLNDGKAVMKDRTGYTKVKTVYRILNK
jgi:hypothetical protein